MSTKAPNPVDRYVGSRVRMRRIMLGMSQEKLGEALGLTFQQIQKYEKGTNRVGASRLQQISEILQVPVSFLFDGGPSGLANAGPSRQRSPYSILSLGADLWPAKGLPATGALRTRFGDAGPNPLHDHGPLELGEHPKHLKHGLARRRAGIEALAI